MKKSGRGIHVKAGVSFTFSPWVQMPKTSKAPRTFFNGWWKSKREGFGKHGGIIEALPKEYGLSHWDSLSFPPVPGESQGRRRLVGCRLWSALPKVHCSVLFLTAAKEEKGNPRRLSVPALIAVSGSQSGRDFNPQYCKSHWFWGMCLPGSWLCIDADWLLPNTWFPRNDCNKCRLSDCWVIYFLEVSLFSKLKGRCVGCVFPVSRLPTCPTPVTPSGTGGLLPHDLSTQRDAWGHMTGDFFSGVRAN